MFLYYFDGFTKFKHFTYATSFFIQKKLQRLLSIAYSVIKAQRPRRVEIEPVQRTAFWKLVLIDYGTNSVHEIVKLNYARFRKRLRNQ